MCKEIIYFCAELLNYWSMTFFGLKLFAKVYGFEVHKNKIVENIWYALMCLPISLFAAGNSFYEMYSTMLTYVIIICIFIIVKLLERKNKILFSLVAFYFLSTRLIDLWIVAVITEANRISRHIYVDLIHLGLERVIYMIILFIIYYFLFCVFRNNDMIYYLKNNIFYCRMICLYSLVGNGCFSRVYLLNNKDSLIGYWSFYLVCAFLMIGIFLVYFVKIKSKEREKLLNMRNDMLETNYKGLQKSYEINRTLQHDYKNHMLAISGLIKEKKNDEALDYIQNYLIIENKFINEIQSGNDIISIIVSSKISETLEKGIDFVYEIDCLNNLAMESIDICSLLANLLDNAVESCEKIIQKTPKIYLKIIKKNNMLIIQIINSVHSYFKKKEYLFHTEKGNSQTHGWGMISIDNVVKKYDGTKEYYIKDDTIEIFITIPI